MQAKLVFLLGTSFPGWIWGTIGSEYYRDTTEYVIIYSEKYHGNNTQHPEELFPKNTAELRCKNIISFLCIDFFLIGSIQFYTKLNRISIWFNNFSFTRHRGDQYYSRSIKFRRIKSPPNIYVFCFVRRR